MRKSVVALLVGQAVATAPSAKAVTGNILYALQSPDAVQSYGGGSFSYGGASTYPQEAAGGYVVGYAYNSTTQRDHALLWNGPSGSFADLDADLAGSYTANGTDGVQEVGQMTYGTYQSAMLWTGAGNQIGLEPESLSGNASTWANAVSGNQQVGAVFYVSNGAEHAMLWNGTAASALDINPAGYTASQAYGTDGTQQVGLGVIGGNPHAMLWSGSAAGAVDLNPAGFVESWANGVSGTQQVGYGKETASGNDCALVWDGSSLTGVNLNPLTGFTSSMANDTNGAEQVGYATLSNGDENAMLWLGTAASAVDLQTLLPASGTWYDSRADSIDSLGNIYGTAYGSYNGTLATFAVEWSASSVPEPTGLLAIAACAICIRRRAR